MPVVADTGPIVAAASRSDDLHEVAAALIIAAGRDLLVPETVVTEADWLIRERVGVAAARGFLRALVDGAYQRVMLSPSLFTAAIDIDQRYGDLDLGLVDASVMAVAEATNSAILTFDFQDFRAAPPRSGGAWHLVFDEAELLRWKRRRL